MFLKRGITFASVVYPHFLSRARSFGPKSNTTIPILHRSEQVSNYSSSFHLSPLFPSDAKPHSDSYDIELVDHDAWRVSSGLALAGRGTEGTALESSYLSEEVVDEPVDNCSLPVEGDPDFDDIDNMRIRGSLFYKLDRDSKEYEEYNFDFHGRKKSSKQKDDPKEIKRKSSELKESKQTAQFGIYSLEVKNKVEMPTILSLMKWTLLVLGRRC